MRILCRASVLGWCLICVSVAQAADPGAPVPVQSAADGQRRGSVLIFPYLSVGADANAENSRIVLTNASDTYPTFLHAYFLNNITGAVISKEYCLVSNQTISLQLSDVLGGGAWKGYAIFVSVYFNGCPNKFNSMTGVSYVKRAGERSIALQPLAVPAIAANPTVCTSGTATLRFDGVSYGRLPRALALEPLPSPANGNATLLVLNRLGGDLTAFVPPALGMIEGQLFAQNGTPATFSFNEPAIQLSRLLTDAFPVTNPALSALIPAGKKGWMQLWGANDYGLCGVALNTNTSANFFSGGETLRALTLTSTVTYTLAVTQVTCE